MSQHGLSEHSHGSFVPLQIRSERPKSKSVSDFPPIDSRQDLWRYLSVDQLKGLDRDVLGEFEQEVEFSSNTGVDISWIESSDPLVGSTGLPEDRVAAAAYTNASKTLLVKISGEQEDPIWINITGKNLNPAALHLFIHSP